MKPKYNQNGAKMKQRWHQTRTGNPHMQTRVWKYSNRAKRKPNVAKITPQYTQHAKINRASRSMSSQVSLEAFGPGETHIFMKSERGA